MEVLINTVRNIAAVVIGVIVGGAVNMLIGLLNVQFFPVPEGMDSVITTDCVYSCPCCAFVSVICRWLRCSIHFETKCHVCCNGGWRDFIGRRADEHGTSACTTLALD